MLLLTCQQQNRNTDRISVFQVKILQEDQRAVLTLLCCFEQNVFRFKLTKNFEKVSRYVNNTFPSFQIVFILVDAM